MFRFQLAYRFQDNTVAGFVQGGFTKDGARVFALADARKACDVRGEAFNINRVIETDEQSKSLTPDELATINKDWSDGRGKGILATRKDMLRD
jgi:hypothetical protein